MLSLTIKIKATCKDTRGSCGGSHRESENPRENLYHTLRPTFGRSDLLTLRFETALETFGEKFWGPKRKGPEYFVEIDYNVL